MQNLFEEIKVPQTELENIVNEKLDMIRKDSRKKKRAKILCGFTAAAARSEERRVGKECGS